MCAQSVDVKEFSVRETCFLKNKVNSYEQQMEHVISNFGNINHKTELEKVVFNEKVQVQLEEIRNEKHTNFLNLKTYEEQADQTDLSQINKSNECVNSAQINSKVTDIKWSKRTVAIVGDSVMSGIREEFLKTDKHNVKVRFFRGL